MKKTSASHMILLVTILLYVGVSLLTGYMPFISRAATIVIGQTCVFLPTIIYCLTHRINLLKMTNIRRINFPSLILSVLVLIFSYPIVMTLNFISMLFVDNVASAAMDVLMPYGFAFAFFAMAVMPAFGEELLFRGVLYSRYRTIKPLAGALLSAFLFALMHLNFNQIPYAFVLGLIFAIMVEATGSILSSMLMHLLLNGASIVVGFASPAMLSLEGITTDMTFDEMIAIPGVVPIMITFLGIISAICLAVIIALMALTCRVNNKRLRDLFKRRELTNNQNVHSDLLYSEHTYNNQQQNTAEIINTESTGVVSDVSNSRLIDIWLVFSVIVLIICMILF